MRNGAASILAVAVIAAFAGAGVAQVTLPGPAQQPETGATAPAMSAGMERLRPDYVLGPGDQILIRAFEMEELGETPFRVDGEGYVNLPVLGRIKAGDTTVAAFEALLTKMLARYVRTPQVSVTVVQFRSEPVFFVGAFRTPGIYPLQGRRTLVEMLSAIGGLQPNASRRIKVTRRSEYGAIPLPNAAPTPDSKGTMVEISMASLRENVNPAEDIALQPFDVISVERAEMVYVQGAVARVGGVPLEERTSLSVIQALSMSGGLAPEAKPKEARILRPVMNTSRRAEIPINLKRILEGKESDFPLMPNDVLFVPGGQGFFRRDNLMWIASVGMAAANIALWSTR